MLQSRKFNFLQYLRISLFIHLAAFVNADPYVYDDCPIPGAGNITIGGPLTFSESSYVVYGTNLRNGALLFQQWVNYEKTPRGVWINGDVYCIRLYFEDDHGKADDVVNITTNLIQEQLVDFIIGPYSSTLTGYALQVTDPAGYLLLCSGASTESMFKAYNYGYTILAPANRYYTSILRSLYYEFGAKTVGYLYESGTFPNESCNALADTMANISPEMMITASVMVPEGPSYDMVKNGMEELLVMSSDFDIVIGCVYVSACMHMTNAMKELEMEPGAFIFSSCAAQNVFAETMGDDGKYLLGIVPWSTEMTYEDDVSGWTTQDFVSNYSNAFGLNPTHHAAGQFSMLEILITAIEKLDTMNQLDIALELSRLDIQTIFGPVEFSEFNLNKIDSATVQLDEDLALQLVVPESMATSPIIYPMISWTMRECYIEYSEGSCECSDDCADCGDEHKSSVMGDCNTMTNTRLIKYAWNASECKVGGRSPPDDVIITCGFIPSQSPLGISLLIITSIVSIVGPVCGIWIFFNRESKIIMANQPAFLIIFCIGCFVLSMITMTFIGPPTVPICTARFSFIIYGFTLMFGTLFILVYRVWRIFSNKRLSKVRVRERDVLKILIGMLAIDTFIMVLWLTALKPTITTEDGDSVDMSCTSPRGFMSLVVVYKFSQLLTGCYLSFRTRNVDRKYLQSNLIMIAMFNMSILWLFLLITTQLGLDEVSSSVICIFTMLSSCVIGLVFIVIPKIYMHITDLNHPNEVTMDRVKTMNGRKTLGIAKSQLFSKAGIPVKASKTDDADFFSDAITMFSNEDYMNMMKKCVELEATLQALEKDRLALISENLQLNIRIETNQKVRKESLELIDAIN